MNQHTQESKEQPVPVEPQQEKNLPFWRVVLSVMQGGFGVQSASNRERDFKQGKVLPFIVAALLFTCVFVLLLLTVVSLVL